eukprot:g31688.t1
MTVWIKGQATELSISIMTCSAWRECFYNLHFLSSALVISDPLDPVSRLDKTRAHNVARGVFAMYRVKAAFDYALSALTAPSCSASSLSSSSSLLARIISGPALEKARTTTDEFQGTKPDNAQNGQAELFQTDARTGLSVHTDEVLPEECDSRLRTQRSLTPQQLRQGGAPNVLPLPKHSGPLQAVDQHPDTNDEAASNRSKAAERWRLNKQQPQRVISKPSFIFRAASHERLPGQGDDESMIFSPSSNLSIESEFSAATAPGLLNAGFGSSRTVPASSTSSSPSARPALDRMGLAPGTFSAPSSPTFSPKPALSALPLSPGRTSLQLKLEVMERFGLCTLPGQPKDQQRDGEAQSQGKETRIIKEADDGDSSILNLLRQANDPSPIEPEEVIPGIPWFRTLEPAAVEDPKDISSAEDPETDSELAPRQVIDHSEDITDPAKLLARVSSLEQQIAKLRSENQILKARTQLRPTHLSTVSLATTPSPAQPFFSSSAFAAAASSPSPPPPPPPPPPPLPAVRPLRSPSSVTFSSSPSSSAPPVSSSFFPSPCSSSLHSWDSVSSIASSVPIGGPSVSLAGAGADADKVLIAAKPKSRALKRLRRKHFKEQQRALAAKPKSRALKRMTRSQQEPPLQPRVQQTPSQGEDKSEFSRQTAPSGLPFSSSHRLRFDTSAGWRAVVGGIGGNADTEGLRIVNGTVESETTAAAAKKTWHPFGTDSSDPFRSTFISWAVSPGSLSMQQQHIAPVAAESIPSSPTAEKEVQSHKIL